MCASAWHCMHAFYLYIYIYGRVSFNVSIQVAAHGAKFPYPRGAKFPYPVGQKVSIPFVGQSFHTFPRPFFCRPAPDTTAWLPMPTRSGGESVVTWSRPPLVKKPSSACRPGVI